jgi:hypothetical protein
MLDCLVAGVHGYAVQEVLLGQNYLPPQVADVAATVCEAAKPSPRHDADSRPPDVA